MAIKPLNSFDRLPTALHVEILKYADARVLAATKQVCKKWQRLWQTDPQLSQARHKLALNRVHEQMIEGRYPPEWRQIFRQNNRPISQLPVLDSVRDATSDYIDFLDVHDMEGEPIVRFIDGRNRPGIALCVEYTRTRLSRLEQQLLDELAQEDPEEARRVASEPSQTVLALFKRYEDQPQSRWTYAALADIVIAEIREAHQKNNHAWDAPCPDCPFPEGRSRVNPKLIQQLLSHQIPTVRICAPRNEVLAEPPQ